MAAESELERIETAQLAEARAEINRLHEELERRVAERTLELAATNEELRREIAERERLEAARRKQREQYEALVHSIDGIVWEVEAASFRFTFVSRQAEKLLGYPVERWTREPTFWTDHLHPDDREAALRCCVDATARKADHQLEYRMIAADGRVVWLRDIVSVIVADDGSTRLRGVMVDITEHRRAEENLRRSEQRFRALIENSSDAITLFDKHGAILYASPSTPQVLGYTPDEIVGFNAFDLIHPDERELSAARFDEVTRQPRARIDIQLRVRHRNGSYRWQEATFTNLLDEPGIEAIVNNYRDINERKQAEAERRQLLRALSERVKELTAMHRAAAVLQREELDTPAMLHELAELLPRAFQYSEAATVRLRLGQYEAATPNFSDAPDSLSVTFTTADGQPGSIEIVYSRESSSRPERSFIVEERALVNTLAEMLLTTYNRRRAEENLRQSEQQLAEAQQLAGIGSWHWDLINNRLRWSDEIYRIYGLSKQEFVPDHRAFMELVYEPDRNHVVQTLKHSLKTGEPLDYYLRIVHHDGQLRTLHSRGTFVFDEQGTPTRMFGAVRDVTERQEAEEQLKTFNEKLRALTASLETAREEEGTRIAREIHDELGASLTSLRWELERLDKDVSATITHAPRAALRKKIGTLIKLTDATISTVRRIASELRPSVLDDLGLIEAIEWQAQQFQARTGILCKFECPLEHAELQQMQSTYVFRIFQEALTNVLRHAQATEVEINVEAEANELVLTIRDNGRGITDEEKLGTKSLGLLGMRERAHLLGGRIEIKGVSGQGTAVTVRVPISRNAR